MSKVTIDTSQIEKAAAQVQEVLEKNPAQVSEACKNLRETMVNELESSCSGLEFDKNAETYLCKGIPVRDVLEDNLDPLPSGLFKPGSSVRTTCAEK